MNDNVGMLTPKWVAFTLTVNEGSNLSTPLMMKDPAGDFHANCHERPPHTPSDERLRHDAVADGRDFHANKRPRCLWPCLPLMKPLGPGCS